MNTINLPLPLRVLPDMAPVWRDLDTDFDNAAQELVTRHQHDGEARDLPVLDLRGWALVPSDGRLALAPLGGHHPPRPLRSNAFSNLALRLGVPTEFVRDKLPAPLQIATLNFLLADLDKSMTATLRLRGDEISALVSDRYAPLDSEDLVDAIRAALVQHGALHDVRVRALATGVTDVMRLVFPAEQVAVKVGDISAIGLDISSSSFGRSAVHVRGICWRLACENGLRVPEQHGSLSFRHVGESQRLRDGIGEAVPSCLAQARGLMTRWRAAVNVMVQNVEEMITAMRELTQGERENVETELLHETGLPALPESVSLYDLTNALTGSARQAEPGRRLELESLAGGLLSRHVGAA